MVLLCGGSYWSEPYLPTTHAPSQHNRHYPLLSALCGDGADAFALQVVDVPKLEDAHWAGTAKGPQCTLILTEGDSAKVTGIAPSLLLTSPPPTPPLDVPLPAVHSRVSPPLRPLSHPHASPALCCTELTARRWPWRGWRWWGARPTVCCP